MGRTTVGNAPDGDAHDVDVQRAEPEEYFISPSGNIHRRIPAWKAANHPARGTGNSLDAMAAANMDTVTLLPLYTRTHQNFANKDVVYNICTFGVQHMID